MRLAIPVFVVSAVLLLAAGSCQAQTSKIDTCRTDVKIDGRLLTPEEAVHFMLSKTPRQDREKLAVDDVEFVLLCGSQRDAEDLFRDLAGKTVRMIARVIEADEHTVRVVTDMTPAFRFHFEIPLKSLPPIGSAVIIAGTYDSYSRDAAIINIKNSTAAPCTGRAC
jgi:hypothetical protein